MNKLTNQEVFDKVVTALRAQGCKSLDHDDNCMYRGNNNTKCAAGHILPDELYNPKLEQYIVYDIDIFDSLVENLQFLRHLQRIHDTNKVSSWEDHWKKLAGEHNLIYIQPTA